MPRAELDTAVERWVQQILACAPLSLKAIKQVVRQTGTLSPAQAHGMRLPALVAALQSEDSNEGVLAFQQKRKPQWQGPLSEGASMAHVITTACIDCKDGACVQCCPVDCIYEGERTLYIHPDECIDCGVCVSACPTQAIYEEFRLPPELAALHRDQPRVLRHRGQRPGLARRRRRAARGLRPPAHCAGGAERARQRDDAGSSGGAG